METKKKRQYITPELEETNLHPACMIASSPRMSVFPGADPIDGPNALSNRYDRHNPFGKTGF